MRWFLVAAVLASGCSSKKSSDGLPPAQEWSQNSAGAMVQTGPNAIPPPAPPPGMANPRGGNGMAGGNDPHAGLGIDPVGGRGGDDPHAGLDMNESGSPDVTKLGLPPPDPDRNVDPTRYVNGVIRVHMKAQARAKAGIPIFIVVKRADASGQPTGTPLAFDKLIWNNGELNVELTEQQAMVAGTELTGEVIVSARYDQDSDALSKEPGDIVGQVKVKLPADNVQIWLDTIL
ncbi:hypothetical protein BH11MYX3_BH11MYX3_45550 [soil metagenome]